MQCTGEEGQEMHQQPQDQHGLPAPRHRPRLTPRHHQRQPLQGLEQEEEKFEYGSREADQAAQKLQSLGAMVYPPGNKAAIDWGVLAGQHYSPSRRVPGNTGHHTSTVLAHRSV